MRALINAMTRSAAQSQNGVTGTRQGVITAYDPVPYAVKVQLQPTGEETGWIPLATPWVGNGWGMAAGPMIGAVVEVEFDSGLVGAGMAAGQFYNDIDRCPGPPSGEFWLIHQSGSMLKFLNDGQVLVTAHTNAVYTAQLHHFVGPVKMDGTLDVTGNVHSDGVINSAVDVVANGKSGFSHTHHENGEGGNTGGPN